jgi:hypothetical protein
MGCTGFGDLIVLIDGGASLCGAVWCSSGLFLHPKQRLLPCLQHSPPFLLALVRLSLSLGFSFFMAFLASPFLRLPELFYLSCGDLPLGSFESFPSGGELSPSPFGFSLRPALFAQPQPSCRSRPSRWAASCC